MLLLPRARLATSPRWMLSNGESTIGPVETELLVRGVRQGRIPEHCRVRDVRSEQWRALDQVREVRALREEGRSVFATIAAALRHARDEGEVFLFLLHGAASATHSAVAALHRFRDPVPLPVTSCVFGLSHERLGEVVPAGDPLLELAASGETLLGGPDDSYLTRFLADRLDAGQELRGVAMVPLLYGNELAAMLDLGRSDHAYRFSDLDALQKVAVLASDRLEELCA